MLEIKVDGKALAYNDYLNPILLSLPYTPKTGELEGSLAAALKSGDGKTVLLPRSRYDAQAKAIIIYSPGAGIFEVRSNPVSLSDVAPGAWYKNAVDYLAARSIISADKPFKPTESITRGEFMVLLMKSLGIAADGSITDNFSDAAGKDYAAYLATAKRLGLSYGVGGNRFAPDEKISRQDLFVMFYRALEKLELLPDTHLGRGLSDFKDAGGLASYAVEPVSYFISTGVVNGNGKEKLILPTAGSDRAQAAQILYNVLTK